jgi:hypothetical protein
MCKGFWVEQGFKRRKTDAINPKTPLEVQKGRNKNIRNQQITAEGRAFSGTKYVFRPRVRPVPSSRWSRGF